MIAWIQQSATIWSEYAIWIIVQNTIFLLLIFGLLHLFKNRSANEKYWIGMAAFIKCLLPPFLPAPFFQESVTTLATTQIRPMEVLSVVTEPSPTFSLSFIESLFLGWLFLTLFIILIPVVQTLRLKYKLKNSRLITSRDFSHSIPIYMTDKILVPMTLGFVNPRIYVPQKWTSWSTECQTLILRHEMAHIRRKDAWFRILQMIVQAIYAFHPLIWMLNRKMDEYREMACDDVSVGPQRSLSVEYARALVQIAENLKQSQLSYVSASALIKQRNELLNRVQYQMEEPMKKLSKLKTALMIGLLFILIVPLSWTKSRVKNEIESIEHTTVSDQENIGTGKIIGTVIDTETGLPLVGANIVIEGTTMGAASDENGNYFISNIKPGKYNLKVSMIGYGSLFIKDVKVDQSSSAQTPLELMPQVIQFSKIKAQLENEKIMNPPTEDIIVFVNYNEPPQPLGGFEAIQKNLVYPEIARKAGIEGQVIVQTLIGADGIVKKTKVVQSLGSNGCDEAAIRTIKSVKWQPAMNRDKPVAVWIAVPMDFRLSNDTSSSHSDQMIPEDNEEEFVFVPFDTPPQPIGGFEAIQNNLIYPDSERKAGIEGKVVVFILVDKSGNVVEAKIEESVSEACDQAAIDALKSVKWQPAMQRDKPVAVWISVPMEFSLN